MHWVVKLSGMLEHKRWSALYYTISFARTQIQHTTESTDNQYNTT